MEQGVDSPEKSAGVPVGEPANGDAAGDEAAKDTEAAAEAVDTPPDATVALADRGQSQQDAAPRTADSAAPDGQAAHQTADLSADRSGAAGGRPRKRVLTGEVVSDKAEQSIVVSIAHRKKHRLYKKYRVLTKKLMAHDPDNSCRVGDVVRVIESRPLSRMKRWRLVEIVKRADRAGKAQQS